MPPDWLQTLARVYIPLCGLSAAVVLADMYLARHRQAMLIMEAVWPLTMLYLGPIGLVAYFWFGRNRSTHASGRRHSKAPLWQAVFKGATHCGAGCALGDFIGDWTAFGIGFSLAGSKIAGTLVLAFALAYSFGIVFQYFAIAPMRGLGFREGLVAAIKIDTLSLLAYEVGMFGWMIFRSFAYPELEPTTLTYWLMMQVAMILGFITTYPINWWLIRRGIKEAM